MIVLSESQTEPVVALGQVASVRAGSRFTPRLVDAVNAITDRPGRHRSNRPEHFAGRLIGRHELADQLGVSTSAIPYRIEHLGLPGPIVELHCGPIFDRFDSIDWQAAQRTYVKPPTLPPRPRRTRPWRESP